MRPRSRYLSALATGALLASVALLLPGTPGHSQAPAPGAVPNALVHGLTPEQVRQILGPPRRTARQILAHRALEQWLYEQPRPLRLEFDCPRGQKPFLVRVRPLHPPAP